MIVPPYEMYKPKVYLKGGMCVEWRGMFGSLIHESEKQHNKIATLRLGITRPGFWYLFTWLRSSINLDLYLVLFVYLQIVVTNYPRTLEKFWAWLDLVFINCFSLEVLSNKCLWVSFYFSRTELSLLLYIFFAFSLLISSFFT